MATCLEASRAFAIEHSAIVSVTLQLAVMLAGVLTAPNWVARREYHLASSRVIAGPFGRFIEGRSSASSRADDWYPESRLVRLPAHLPDST